MLSTEIADIIAAARTEGWVLEPEALRLLGAAGVSVPRFAWAKSKTHALEAAAGIGYPVVAKVVSPQVMHKSDVQGVQPGIPGAEDLTNVYDRFSRLPGFEGLVVAEMLSGRELIVGAKVDFQFGPVILLGIGGTAVEIYNDTATRMAPLKARDIESMLACLRGSRLLTGYRGCAAVNIPKLTKMMLAFSDLVMELGDRIDSIDLNPVFCSPERCTVADARIVLASESK
jgi:acetate---CoA ligase (ADP-forming) subunit beta